MNYYYQESKKTNYGEIITHPTFDKLVSFFSKHKDERIILRQLHVLFPEKDFEKFLDKLISLGLVIRENRQYRLGFPIFEESDESEISEVVHQIIEQVRQIPQEDQPAYLGEVVWPNLFSQESYFYGVNYKTDFYTKSVAGNQSIQLVSIGLRNQSSVTLPNYFSLIKQKKSLPSSFNALYKLIGDVNEIYFFNQVEMILEKMENGRLRTRRRNIFLESLIETDVVAESLSQLNWPIVHFEEWKDNICTDSQLKKRSSETIEERMYQSNVIFKKLLKDLGIARLDYLKKSI